MTDVTQIERALLNLPPAERERLVLRAWESLVGNGDAASDRNIDPEGVKLASNRDAAIECGDVDTVSEEVFRRRTDGLNES